MPDYFSICQPLIASLEKAKRSSPAETWPINQQTVD
jgi:hypothetical protein